MAGYSVTYTVVDNATKQITAINRRIEQMRAPLDRMSRQVQRFIDVSGLRKVATGFEWIGKAASTVLRTLTAIVPVMGAITGAASIAGMAKLVSSYAAWSHELVQAADNIGITTQQLQQFQDATRLAGGNAGDMTESLKGLHDTLGNINIGSGNAAQAVQWFNKLGISVRDANGHIRSTADLMPELIQKIANMKDPLDRARAANELLGASGDKLVETFRQSSQSFAQWFSDVSRYKDLTDEQKRSLQQFGEAQGRVAVAFDRLGQQISVVIARDFGPLLQHIAEFVEKHTPEIIAAIDRISKKFAAWLEGIDWGKVEDGINKLLDSLKWVVDHLDTIKTVAEDIAILFAVKWGIGMVASIGKVIGAIGTAGETGSLLGKLALVASAATLAFSAWEKAQNPETYAPKNLAPDSPFWRGIPEEEQRKYPNSPLNQKAKPGGPSFTESPSGWLSNRLGGVPLGGVGRLIDRAVKGPASVQPLGLPPAQAGQAPAALAALPGDTSWGDYGTRANNPGNMNYASWQNAAGRFSYMDQTEGRQHTMAVYNTMEEGVSDAYKLMLRKQEANGKTISGALSAWSTTPGYAAKVAGMAGLDPNAPFDVKTADPAMVERLMAAQFKMEGRRGSHSATEQQILAGVALGRGGPATPPVAVAQAAAPPVAVPPQPVNGAVDVSITHKNPPPNSAVTASGSGSVNVAPVRVEHQEMASI